ncbi:CdaR family transcriptional regulator [Escherichia coli]|nr:CdaR family transcriptional regulator [Escherichia coli]HAZ3680420.1 CdaR family transcriptional regulator [Escherichia coli]HAZ3906475.1 CdaR family transcriptional regulator [Escherichia coli]HBA7074198.1 CdaR family transcriptional regulator [Escherichia coli]HBA7189102.1 CdaR family transcriptional regulator [Escherichia coli]
MADYYFDIKLADSIVERTMKIIDYNINVMDARGRIISSGDRERIGEIHEGALLALSQQRVVSIDNATMHTLHGVKPGLNLPLRLNNQLVGVIGLTGDPEELMQVGELVCMTAEMMLEQAHLHQQLAQNCRLREELVLSMVKNDAYSSTMQKWALRLGVDLTLPRVAMVVELDSGQLGVSSAMNELQQLQSLLMETSKDNLMAIISLTEMVVLKPAYFHAERWEPEEHQRRMMQLYHRLQQSSPLKVRMALGNFFPQEEGVKRSYHTAKTTISIGKQRMPDVPCFCYQDIKLPVLLDSLRDGWQAAELAIPLQRLKANDGSGVFRKTLQTWFLYNQQVGETANALFIHKNTLEYRLRRIAELTGLNLANYEDRFLLYVAVLLD